MNKEQRDAMRKLAEEATPGPWRNQMHRDTNYASIYMLPDSTESLAGYCGESNASHIAAANPSTILQLLDYIETLEKDAARLDFIEQEAMLSRTGISFDYARITEDGYVVERGWRMCKWHSLGERKTSIRNAIDAAMQGETK